MEREKKMDRRAVIAFPILYVVMFICLFLFHPFAASAAEKAPGGANNKVSVRSQIVTKSNGKKVIDSYDFKVSGDYEAIGYLNELDDYYRIDVIFCKDGVQYSSTTSVSFNDFLGMHAVYDSEGVIESSVIYDKSYLKSNISVYYKSLSDDFDVTCNVSGLKIFRDRIAAEAYIKNGDLDGLVEGEDDVDSGTFDTDIGYLHNLKRHALMYGEQDENGFYSSYDDRFTWSDYYPEYDDSYLVEVRATCEVEVRKWFGIGKSTVYNSDIRQLATGVTYKDLEYIVSLADQKAVFSDFINEYMPGNGSVSDVISAATYQFDKYYFRIYRWDEETESYHYGLWVKLTKNGSALDASLDYEIEAGDIDDDGNWIPDPDSDYGDGEYGSTIVGAGDNQDDAKDEADQKQEDKDNGGKPIDLSNTNFKELWEWFTGSLLTLWNGIGIIPDFFGRLFSFLPSPIIAFFALGIVVAIILRVLGR